MTDDDRMKPIMILPPGAMKPEDIKRLNDNGLCVVEAADPAAVRFLDPIPSVASRTAVEQAAISLSRKVLSPGVWTEDNTRRTVAAWYVDLLIKGTPLDPKPSQAECERQAYDEARIEEMRRIAREEARAERAAAKPATKPSAKKE